MPSTENDVMNGIAPASEIWPLESCWTPCASVATTIGLVLLVARKLSASLLMSWPEMELSIVGALALDHRADGSDFDLLARCGDLQLRVGAHDLAREQLDIARGVGEALQADDHDVAARVDVGQVEVAGASGHGGPSAPVAELVSVTVAPGRAAPD